jgi:DNA-directed RNA polymerase beta subunit
MTFSAPLRVNVQLIVRETGEVKEQELFMGDFPLMTANGTFVINGAERVVVSQLVRSPGVYFTLEIDPTTGRELCFGKLIPNRGAWLEFETSNKNVLSVKVDRKRKIPVTTLLRAIDEEEGVPEDQLGTNERILEKFADVDTNADHPYIAITLDKEASTNKKEALLDFYRRLRPGDPPTLENARGLLNSLFFNSRRYDLGRVGRYKLNRRLELDTAPGRHRPPGKPPCSCRRRADPEPVPGGPAAHGARRPRTHDDHRPGPGDAERADQHPAGRGVDEGVLWRVSALAVHGPDEPAGGADAQAASLRARPRRSLA